MTSLNRYLRYITHQQLPGVAGLLVASTGALILYLTGAVRLESFLLAILGLVIFLSAGFPQFRKYEHQQEITFLSDLKVLAEEFEDHSITTKSDSEDVRLTRLIRNLTGNKIGDEMLTHRRAAVDVAEEFVRAWLGFWKTGLSYLLQHPGTIAKEHLESHVFYFWYMVSLHFTNVIEKGIKLVNDGQISRDKSGDLERFNNYKTRYNFFALKFTEFLKRVSSQMGIGAGSQTAKTIDKDIVLV